MLLHTRSVSQTIGINTTDAIPDSSAMLDIISADKGLLIPRIHLISTTDTTTISNPATSLLVYNTNDTITGGSGSGYYYFNGSKWMNFLSGNNGNVGIGTSAPLSKLGVSGNLSIGATYAAIAAPANGVIIQGNVGIGTSTELYAAGTGIAPLISVANTANAVVVLKGFANSTAGCGILALAKSRSTSKGTDLITQSGDLIGRIEFDGVDSSNTKRVASYMDSYQDGVAGSNAVPGRISFFTGTNTAVPTEKMRITSTGNIGIGTATPGAKLHVNGGNQFLLNSGGDPRFIIGDVTSSSSAYGSLSWNSTSDYLYLGIGNSAYLSILNGGSVGIGTSAPETRLHILGAANSFPATSGTTQTGSNVRLQNVGSGVMDFGCNSSGGGWIQYSDRTNLAVNYPLLLNPNGGNIGIGTSAPTNPLHVVGSTVGGLFEGSVQGVVGLKATGQTTYSMLSNATGMIGFYRGSGSLHDFGIRTGNVGIGYNTATTTYSYTLGFGNQAARTFGIEASATDVIGRRLTISAGSTVAGTSVSDVTGGDVVINAGLGTGTGSSNIYFQTGTTLGTGTTLHTLSTKMFINGAGNVGIGTTSPSEKLHVVGNVCYTGTIGACSDFRYKKDITHLPNALNNVLKIQGISYFWKTKEFPDKQFTDTKQIGFIAQEIEKIYPEIVLTDNDGYKSVDYSRLTPVLVEAIKELNSKNEEQKKIIDTLKSTVNKEQINNNNFKNATEKQIAELRKIVEKLAKQNNLAAKK